MLSPTKEDGGASAGGGGDVMSAAVANLETLLFKATSPANKIEDVNTIKAFTDAVNTTPDGAGPVLACRLLAHKIQSPQEREALQALAVLEASVKACGPAFAAEIGKFKFLNEMIKLVSPKYLGPRTPVHIQKKVVELLFTWTKELKNETKIKDAYEMLKSQGIIRSDPEYVGEAVFASGLKKRTENPLSKEQTEELKRLLQSKNPEDMKKANKIIKSMVTEDERKMDALSRTHSDLIMADNNSKLLNEMLDHFDRTTATAGERDLLKELYESCERIKKKLYQAASEWENEDGDDNIGKIIAASEEVSRAIGRYNLTVIEGKIEAKSGRKTLGSQNSDTLLDLNHGMAAGGSQDDDFLGLDLKTNPAIPEEKQSQAAATSALPEQPQTAAAVGGLTPAATALNNSAAVTASTSSAAPIPSLLEDFLGDNKAVEDEGKTGDPLIDSIANLMVNNASNNDASPRLLLNNPEKEKTSRQKGLDELDFLGESAIKSVLSSRSPQFEKREKVSMVKMMEQKKEIELKSSSSLQHQQQNHQPALPVQQVQQPQSTQSQNRAESIISQPQSQNGPSSTSPVVTVQSREEVVEEKAAISSDISTEAPPSVAAAELPSVKLADLNVKLTDIRPGKVKPLTLQDPEDGISVLLNFGKDQPRPGVSAIVVTVLNKSPEPLEDFELKAVVPKGCKVKLQPPSTDNLPAFNPFVPPPAITQVMLIANPKGMKPVSLKYVLSYTQDEEPQTEMGEVKELPI